MGDSWTSGEQYLPNIPHSSAAILLSVEANGGTVELQRRTSDGTNWFTFETFVEDTEEPIQCAGARGWRIVSTGGAKFRWNAN